MGASKVGNPGVDLVGICEGATANPRPGLPPLCLGVSSTTFRTKTTDQASPGQPRKVNEREEQEEVESSGRLQEVVEVVNEDGHIGCTLTTRQATQQQTNLGESLLSAVSKVACPVSVSLAPVDCPPRQSLLSVLILLQ
jgi:hypothetical protein